MNKFYFKIEVSLGFVPIEGHIMALALQLHTYKTYFITISGTLVQDWIQRIQTDAYARPRVNPIKLCFYSLSDSCC